MWAYIVSRGIPYNRRIYDAETHGQTRDLRNTGWLSTDGAEDGRIAWLAFHFPDEYETLAEHSRRCVRCADPRRAVAPSRHGGR